MLMFPIMLLIYTLGVKHFVGDVEYKDHIQDANGSTDPQTSVYE